VNAKRHPAAAEGADVDHGRPGDLLEEARIAFEDGRRSGQTGARELRREHRIPPGFGVGESLPVLPLVQKRMATETWDENGWRARVTYMRDVILEGRRFSDEMTEDLVSYFTFAFGPDSPKSASPEDHPEYKSLVRPFNPRAMNIAYVEYDFAALNGMDRGARSRTKRG